METCIQFECKKRIVVECGFDEFIPCPSYKTLSTTAGHVGSSALLIAPSGEQQLEPTGSQLGVDRPGDSSKDKGGACSAPKYLSWHCTSCFRACKFYSDSR